jgi:hypothetical protein
MSDCEQARDFLFCISLIEGKTGDGYKAKITRKLTLSLPEPLMIDPNKVFNDMPLAPWRRIILRSAFEINAFQLISEIDWSVISTQCMN